MKRVNSHSIRHRDFRTNYSTSREHRLIQCIKNSEQLIILAHSLRISLKTRSEVYPRASQSSIISTEPSIDSARKRQTSRVCSRSRLKCCRRQKKIRSPSLMIKHTETMLTWTKRLQSRRMISRRAPSCLSTCQWGLITWRTSSASQTTKTTHSWRIRVLIMGLTIRLSCESMTLMAVWMKESLGTAFFLKSLRSLIRREEPSWLRLVKMKILRLQVRLKVTQKPSLRKCRPV